MDVYESWFKSETPQSEEDMDVRKGPWTEEDMDVRKGPWTEEEDFTLKAYVNIHGEGRWNLVARLSGLKRTGKSCRLRWLNYLRPEVRRGNISLQEQLLILQLHSRWGNRWSKIAQHLPGRTDNEIKNYWRTRVQKQAKQLKCDVNSKQFRDAMHYVWIPRLIERICASSESPSGQPSTITTNQINHANPSTITTNQINYANPSTITTNQINYANTTGSVQVDQTHLPELSGTSSDSGQVSSVSDMTDYYNQQNVLNYSNSLQNGSSLCSENVSGTWNIDDGVEFHSMESVWNEENICFLRQQLYDDYAMN